MSQLPIQKAGGALSQGSRDAIETNFTELYSRVGGLGNIYYCDYLYGSDTTGDGSAAKPYKTLNTAYSKTVSGKNDVVVLVGDGGTTGSQRVSAATTWANSATHLIGVCSGGFYSPRARVAPTSGATAFTPLITVSGSGCHFANIQLWHGFDTGTTSAICAAISGSRNVFKGVHFAGIGDAESAASTGSRCIKITGGENTFDSCVIGVDTVARGVANASVEFASGSARNVFKDCLFPFMSSAGDCLGYIGSAAACMDRTNHFIRCEFINAVKSTATTMSGLGTLAASAGGLLLFDHPCLVGITEFGTDATTRGQCYVVGSDVTAASAGIAVNPT